MWAACKKFLLSVEPEKWDQSTIELLLYILARDNEIEELKSYLTGQPRHLLTLAKAGRYSSEQEARWQLADALGSIQADEAEIVSVLENYVADPDEYVSRRALLALGRRLSPAAAALAQRAWDTGHEYQRMAALEVLWVLGSPLLVLYLEQAVEDGRQYLAEAAGRIRSRLAVHQDRRCRR